MKIINLIYFIITICLLIIFFGLNFVSAECIADNESYYSKGTLTDGIYNLTDICWKDIESNLTEHNYKKLREYSCTLTEPLDINIDGYGMGLGFYEINYYCPNGCNDGACIECSYSETCVNDTWTIINPNCIKEEIPCEYGCFNNTCRLHPECPTCQACEYPSCHCSGGSAKIVYRNVTNNTIEYKILEVPTNINKEVIKEVPIEKLVEISKPFYKNIWFYGFILGIITIIILLVKLKGIEYIEDETTQ